MTKLPVSSIKLNDQNPRSIKDFNYQKLLQSIKDFPEMADVRPIVINKENIVLGGNMRFRAMQEAGWTEIPVKIVDWPKEKQKEFIIKDNISGGDWDWDVLANEWDAERLDKWGLDIPHWNDEINENKEVDVKSLLDKDKTIECPRCHFEFEHEV